VSYPQVSSPNGHPVLAQSAGAVVVVNPKGGLYFPLNMAEIAMQLGDPRFCCRPTQQRLLPIPNLRRPLHHQHPGLLLRVHNSNPPSDVCAPANLGKLSNLSVSNDTDFWGQLSIGSFKKRYKEGVGGRE
jgi:hypothetical protein